MNVGDFFSMTGYEQMGSLQFNHGQVYILSNNSSHILVAVDQDEAMADGDGEGTQVELIGSYSYDASDGSWEYAYKLALDRAVDFVARHLRD